MTILALALLVAGATAQIPGQTQDLSVRVNLYNRRFRLYVPSSWNDSSAAIPLVLNWHGLTDTPDYQEQLSGTNKYAELYGWAFAYPSGWSRSHNGGACCTPAATARIADVKFARAIVSEVGSRMAIRMDAVFSMGYSNGGFMSQRLACEASDLFRAVASHSGRVGFNSDFGSCKPVRPIPVIAISGTLDALVPYLGNPLINFPGFARDREIMQEANGCNLSETPVENPVSNTARCDIYSQCANGSWLEYCRVRGQGHAWFAEPDIDSTSHIMQRFSSLVIGYKPLPGLKLPFQKPNNPPLLTVMP